MNPQGPDELISAYFDGEVSPDERAEVERLLTGNDDAQRELNETARLSALLHSFPREAAPVELAANVLRQTNQIPLPPQPSKAATTDTSKRTVWRDWKAGFAGAAITAVAMCLVVVLNTSQTNEHAQTVATGLHVEMHASPAAAARPDEGLIAMDDRAMKPHEASQPFGAAADVTKDVAAKQAATVPGPMVMSRGRMSLEPKASEPSAVAEMAADASAAAMPAIPPAPSETPAVGLNEPGLSNDDFVNGLREGKVYVLAPQAADPNSNVAVVYLEVIDIDRSAEQMQVLLKKNSIQPRSTNKDGQPMGDDFVVIYTVAEGDKLAKTLKDVDQHRDLFLNWTAQAPLQVAAVSEEPAQPQKKVLAGGGASGDKETQQAKPTGPSEPNGDMPEVQIVLDAYAQRNGFANPAMSNSIVNSYGQHGGNRELAENLKRQQLANAGLEKSKSDSNLRAGTAIQGQLTQLARTESGYDYVRLNNSMVVNNATNPGQANTTQLNPLRMEQSSRPLAFRNKAKMANNDANNRALRMLFVLHPNSDGVQIPAAAAPAKP